MNNSILEFGVLAILIAMMYGFSAIEILSIKFKYPNKEVDDLQKSALWALAGIIFTLLTGILSPLIMSKYSITEAASYFFFLIPLFFIGRWFIWYQASSSVPGKLDKFKNMVDEEYKFVVLTILEEIEDQNQKSFIAYNKISIIPTKDEIYFQLVDRTMAQNEKSKIFELRLLNRVSEYGLKIPAMSDFKVYFDMFLFDQERLEFLLLKLVQDGEISRSEDNSILIYRLN